MSRRRLLRTALLFSAVGAAVVLGVDGLARATPSSESGAGRASTGSSPVSSTAPVAAPSNIGPNASGSSLRVKAMYFQMPQTINTKEEYFMLQSPAYLRDLLSNVMAEHPRVSKMIPTMMILVDGVPGQPSTPLRDGDEVDFIPAIAGG